MVGGMADDDLDLLFDADDGGGGMGRVLHSSTFQPNVSTLCPMWWGALLVSVTKTAQVEQRCRRV